MIVSHLLLILHKQNTVLYLYVWSLKCGKRSQSSRGRILSQGTVFENILTHMMTLCMFIYTVIIIQQIHTWDLNSKHIGWQHIILLDMPSCLCHWLISPVQSWPKVENDTNINFHKSAAPDCMMAICINSRMLWSVIRWIAINCKVPFCHANELNPPKIFPLHFSPATKGPAEMSVILSLTQVWVLTRTRLEITLSCWMSLNNRLEASKGGCCLE